MDVCFVELEGFTKEVMRVADEESVRRQFQMELAANPEHQSQIQSMKTKTKKTEIEFDAHTLLTRVEGFAAGKEPAVERTAKLPPPVRPIPAKEIRAIRTSLGFTQAQFASLLNVPKVTAISWENGTRKPSGAALRLLAVARKHPEALEVA